MGEKFNIGSKLNRRRFLQGTTGVAASLAAMTTMPRISDAAGTVKIGFLAPLTGDVAAWGLPGRDGCLIWADWVNAAGGVKVGDKKFNIEIVSYDNEYSPDKALVGAKRLVLEDKVNFIMMLGGDTWAGVQRFLTEKKMLTSTLLPSDLSPDTPYLIAPCEVHPIYNVTGVEWLRKSSPKAKTVAMCAQEDALGLPSIATYRAAFEAAKFDLVYDKFFPDTTEDFAPIITAMLATKPDVLCWDTSYEPFVHALTEQAYLQGFKGQIISCTADNYPAMIEKTSKEFMEGFIFQFPDFDDPALNDKRVNFAKPNDFFTEYNKRFPGSWSAVSWEYASILDLWKAGVEQAGTANSDAVLKAMKSGGKGKHAFGAATWWGKELFGIDNALVGDWPVVVIKDGRARIAEYGSIPDWWSKNSKLMIKHMRDLGQMWDQR
jgi:branched-chain amino acid transport system substrate-binding protein